MFNTSEMELNGFEPITFRVQNGRSTIGAKTPCPELGLNQLPIDFQSTTLPMSYLGFTLK